MPKQKKGNKENQPKAHRPKVERRSLSRTRERLERRQKTHQHREAKKKIKLEKRISFLESKGIRYAENYGVSRGKRHSRMRRVARRLGIVGPPLSRKPKPKTVEKKEPESEVQEQQADERSA